jgi:hypothetical protein
MLSLNNASYIFIYSIYKILKDYLKLNLKMDIRNFMT